MKKFTTLILVICLVLAMAACGSSKGAGAAGEPANTSSTESNEPEGNEAKESSYELDRDLENEGLHFKYNHDFSISGYNEVTNVYMGEADRPDFVITLIPFYGTSVEDIVEGLATAPAEIDERVYGDNTWTHFVILSETKVSNVFVTPIENGAYTISFQDAPEQLIEDFMNSTYFE